MSDANLSLHSFKILLVCLAVIAISTLLIIESHITDIGENDLLGLTATERTPAASGKAAIAAAALTGDGKSSWYKRLQETLGFNNKNADDVVSRERKETQRKYFRGMSKEAQIEEVVSILANLTSMDRNIQYLQDFRTVLKQRSQIPFIPPEEIHKIKTSPLFTVIPNETRFTYNETWKGYRLPVITCAINGRMGNVIGEYASMYAISKLYNASFVITQDQRNWLGHFPYLSIPLMPVPYIQNEWKPVGNVDIFNYAPVEMAAAGLLGPHRFYMGGYAIEIHLFHKMKDELRREFRYSDKINNETQTFLHGVAKSRQLEGFNDNVFIGFHIRRTDYAHHMQVLYGGTLPDDLYFFRAMDYYRKKFGKKAVFIATSDDIKFVKERIGNFTDIYYSPGKSPANDMAVMNACNHSIVTFGSFGFFCGFLCGGEVVYPDVRFGKQHRWSKAMYQRLGLKDFTPIPVA